LELVVLHPIAIDLTRRLLVIAAEIAKKGAFIILVTTLAPTPILAGSASLK
jgi:hypothetical protein